MVLVFLREVVTLAKQYKRVRAGDLVVESIYSLPDVRQPGEIRARRSRASSEAQRLLNLRHSRLRLELLLAANFGPRDLFVTLTFDDDHLPGTREGVRRRVRAFVRELRKARRIRGASLRYAYALEGKHGDKRFHAHFVLNSTGPIDLDDVAALWPHGSVDVKRLRDSHFWESGHVAWEKLARYLCKERPDPGDVGRQAWTPSKGLRQPETVSRRVADGADITIPPGAELIEQRREDGLWGSFAFLKYRLPLRE